MSKNLQIGDFAPDFMLKDQHGSITRLSDFRNKSNVVLYFYSKDDTAVCTAEACSFRDSYDEFKEVGAEVIGVSSDDGTSHFRFASKFHLPFLLLSDPGGKVRKLFNVPNAFIFIPGRTTFVIDKGGVIRHVFRDQLNGAQHVTEAKKILQRL